MGGCGSPPTPCRHRLLSFNAWANRSGRPFTELTFFFNPLKSEILGIIKSNRGRKKCSFHIFSSSNDHDLTEGWGEDPSENGQLCLQHVNKWKKHCHTCNNVIMCRLTRVSPDLPWAKAILRNVQMNSSEMIIIRMVGWTHTHTHSSIYTDDQKKKNQTKKKGVKDGIPLSNTQSAHRLPPDTVFRGRVRPGSVVVALVADTRRSSEKGEMEEGDAARRSDAHALSRPEKRWMGSLVARKVGTLSTNRSAAAPTNKKVE